MASPDGHRWGLGRRPVGKAIRGEPRPFSITPAVRAAGGAAELARHLGVCDRWVQRRTATGLTWLQADVIAIVLGRHPIELWGSAWWETCDNPEEAA
jgi:hypothetical protein